MTMSSAVDGLFTTRSSNVASLRMGPPASWRGSARRRPREQVRAIPEPVQHAVEVAPGKAVALRRGKRGPAAVLVADQWQLQTKGAPWRPVGIRAGAQHQAPPDVQVPVEDELLVERADLSTSG